MLKRTQNPMKTGKQKEYFLTQLDHLDIGLSSNSMISLRIQFVYIFLLCLPQCQLYPKTDSSPRNNIAASHNQGCIFSY